MVPFMPYMLGIVALQLVSSRFLILDPRGIEFLSEFLDRVCVIRIDFKRLRVGRRAMMITKFMP